MLHLKDALRSIFKIDSSGRRKRHFIFSCKECNAEMCKSSYEATVATGLCGVCSKKVKKPIHSEAYKDCNVCLRHRELTLFDKRENGHYRNECRQCRVISMGFEGFSSLDYENLLKKQNNCCAICDATFSHTFKKNGKIIKLAIDHCHKTGKIRGLLCGKCNQGMGLFNDSIDQLKNAVHYLTKVEDIPGKSKK